MKPRSVMIFAAGRGTRMQPLTFTLPKALIPVSGKPLIDHAIAQADGAGLRNIVVNLHHFPDALRAHLADRKDIQLSDETDCLLETGGGLKAALSLLEGDSVFTLNSDAVWTGRNPLDELASAWRPMGAECLLLLVPTARAIGYSGSGDFDLSADGRVMRGTSFVYSGAQIILTAPVRAHSEKRFSLNAVWNELSRTGAVFGCVHEGGWCDVGRPDNIALAESLVRSGTDG